MRRDGPRGGCSNDPTPAVALALQLALAELAADRDVCPRPGPLRCDVARRRRLRRTIAAS